MCINQMEKFLYENLLYTKWEWILYFYKCEFYYSIYLHLTANNSNSNSSSGGGSSVTRIEQCRAKWINVEEKEEEDDDDNDSRE